MKTLLPLLSLLAFGFTNLLAETVVIAVNFQTVFEEYSELKRLDVDFRGEVEAFQVTQQKDVAALQALQQSFNQLRQQAAQPDVTEEQRQGFTDQATKLLEDMNTEEQRIRQERQTFQQELEAKGVRLRRKIVNDVRRQVKLFAEAQGWDVVLDTSANAQNGLPIVHYANPELDRTRWVITELNQADARRSGEE